VKAKRIAVFVGALAALTTVAGCDGERILAISRATSNPSDAGGGGSDATGNPNDAGQPWTPFGTPQVVPGLRSDTDEVQDPSLTFEGLELYFSSPEGDLSDIWVSRRTVATDPWGPSTLVAELSSPQADEDPSVSVDGLIMYFTSDRGGDGRRVYASRRRTRDTPWETPVRVDLGSSTVDEAPALDRGQLYLVFGSQRGTSSYPHLFAATRPDASAVWQGSMELTALSSAWQDTDPALFADGRGLLFASRRLTQGRAADLFQASRPDTSTPFASSLAPITELNTDYTEEDPWISEDGRHILFTSNRNGRNRIYEAWR
jgi:Tol biopolymer transport system component